MLTVGSLVECAAVESASINSGLNFKHIIPEFRFVYFDDWAQLVSH